MKRPLCFHCNKNLAQKTRGGLCDPCYRMPRIRKMHQESGRLKKLVRNKPRGEAVVQQTMEELEAQIEERSKTMPGKPGSTSSGPRKALLIKHSRRIAHFKE